MHSLIIFSVSTEGVLVDIRNYVKAGIKTVMIAGTAQFYIYEVKSDLTVNHDYRLRIGSTPTTLSFPIINGKSPCYLRLESVGSASAVSLNIQELGGTPDPTYFDDGPSAVSLASEP